MARKAYKCPKPRTRSPSGSSPPTRSSAPVQGRTCNTPAAGTGGSTSVSLPTNPRAETVINRALGLLGVTYAWGGGDANGPTRGIRDGAVADRHGDYAKVGFDRSGLALYAYAGIGVLSRTRPRRSGPPSRT